ncbi:uncharacterized protein LOC111409524 [Olea europaea var. sylvestris]|uniref:uncharacterized protein LOC111409524 n=1 Tax=Olea europaea var. sylvestris TaxID=158386 RepID=UPI000C1D4302|nr:uncharacterized protein LOC111409524 [Olea europaea var. sylvestris]
MSSLSQPTSQPSPPKYLQKIKSKIISHRHHHHYQGAAPAPDEWAQPRVLAPPESTESSVSKKPRQSPQTVDRSVLLAVATSNRNCRTRRPELLQSPDCCASSPTTHSSRAQELLNNTKKSRAQFNMDDLVSDLGIRPPIESYDPNIRDDVRMAYLEKGPCQPYGHDFPRKSMGNDSRCFRKEWFSEFHWLEYIIEKDVAYCLHCYLFKPDRGGQGGGHIFTKTGFRDWKHKKILKDHVGLFDSAHNQAFAKCTNLMNQKQRLSFRGHDESKDSLNRRNIIELLNWYAAHCKEIKEVLFSNVPGNDQMTSPTIQNDLVNCCAVETTRAIINEIVDSLFSILVDELVIIL